MKEIIMASNNKGKIKEAQEIWNVRYTVEVWTAFP